jgi:hypothetical protein
MKTFDDLIDFLLFFYQVLDDFILSITTPNLVIEYEEILT